MQLWKVFSVKLETVTPLLSLTVRKSNSFVGNMEGKLATEGCNKEYLLHRTLQYLES